MATTIPQVKVTRAEGQGGFVITCDQCPKWRNKRLTRLTADELALDHQRSHGRVDPADQVPDFEVTPW